MTSYSELRKAAGDFVRLHAARGVLIVAAQRDAADEIAQEVCPDVLMGVDRYGFRDFVHRASRDELRRRGWVPIGRIVREAIAARVADAAALTYLREVAGFSGFP